MDERATTDDGYQAMTKTHVAFGHVERPREQKGRNAFVVIVL